jgi:hypothetical protein
LWDSGKSPGRRINDASGVKSLDPQHDSGPEKQRIFTAEDAERGNKMALINYMKTDFSEPGPDPDLGISAFSAVNTFCSSGSAPDYPGISARSY